MRILTLIVQLALTALLFSCDQRHSTSDVDPSFASPTTIVSAPINAPTAVLNDNDVKLKLTNNTANVLGSLGTLVAQ